MGNLHTHYDNLKVARNAPIEVIRAAYKILSQKFHPDLNPGNAEAARIMAIINTSYEVLSDPVKRREHDLWIMHEEQGQSDVVEEILRSARAEPPPAPRHQAGVHLLTAILPYFAKYWLLILLGGFVVWGIMTEDSNPPPGPKPYVSTPTPPSSPKYVRPATDPNGRPWPVSAGYVSGFKMLHKDGLSTVTIDNSRNDIDVFAKLVSLDGPQAYPVRVFYIPANGKFTMNKVSVGTYDVRYRDLGNGHLFRSESFQLEEIPMGDRVQYSNISITLYKVRDGNMQTYDLAENEF